MQTMSIHYILGWLGAFFFAVCAVPQVVQTWRTKKAGDLSMLFLLFWLFGEVFTSIYILVDDIALHVTHFPLYANYVANTILVLYLIYAKKYYK